MLRRFVDRAKKHPGLIPQVFFICLGMGGAFVYLLRLAKGPHVVWNRKNPEPWNQLSPNYQYKVCIAPEGAVSVDHQQVKEGIFVKEGYNLERIPSLAPNALIGGWRVKKRTRAPPQSFPSQSSCSLQGSEAAGTPIRCGRIRGAWRVCGHQHGLQEPEEGRTGLLIVAPARRCV
ncbi:hypothetical protein DNTS_003331 [Danionella cerebrum]|uniref:NADH dehydrogenase [ubiquinone] 1 alpha subcomplex subunit 4-like 2 n=1 Tax=Danionella cerebrum TaxID=2873325 RepID=A0A553QPN5_9TELE|nr:hypothetical protein DNTS_003331 [Danionella translucida]